MASVTNQTTYNSAADDDTRDGGSGYNTVSVVFFDSRVQDYQILAAALPQGSAWFLLNPEQDGIEQMLDALSGYRNLDSLQIISHGSPGEIQIGATLLDTRSLNGYNSPLRQIGNHLTETGDILLYGCEVGAGATGQAFIRQLAEMTGADVAASTDPTGAATLGGDWVLEQATGAIEAPVLASDVEVLWLDTDRDGIAQIADYLATPTREASGGASASRRHTGQRPAFSSILCTTSTRKDR